MLTELEIINSMLAASGTAPVAGPETTHPTYIKAAGKLKEVVTDVLKLGLWFNTRSVLFMQSADGEIVLPTNCINADPVDVNLNYVKRGGRMFDMDNSTFVIGADVELKIVERLELEDIPETALCYIKDKARHDFYLDEDGTEPKLSSYQTAATASWVACYREHLRSRDSNIFKGNNAINAFKRGRITRRLAPYE